MTSSSGSSISRFEAEESTRDGILEPINLGETSPNQIREIAQSKSNKKGGKETHAASAFVVGLNSRRVFWTPSSRKGLVPLAPVGAIQQRVYPLRVTQERNASIEENLRGNLSTDSTEKMSAMNRNWSPGLSGARTDTTLTPLALVARS